VFVPAADARALVLVLGSGFIHVGYFVLLLRGYRAADLSLVYPIARGTGPLLAAAGAMLLLGERPTALSVTGTLLIASGVLVIAGRPAGLTPRKLGPGVFYGLATGVSIAAYTLWDGWSVKRPSSRRSCSTGPAR
jgi:drug/metabolite transporter (DMT)-like permease